MLQFDAEAQNESVEEGVRATPRTPHLHQIGGLKKKLVIINSVGKMCATSLE